MTDLPVCVAVIDSGIAAGHPHVGRVDGGRAFVGEDPTAWQDRLGHGTAVAGAIRELSPRAQLLAARVFDNSLATTARLLCDAIDWAAGAGAHLVNLSVGTTNAAHRPLFEAATARARGQGTLIVAAASDRSVSLLPGSLPGVIGVVADATMPRGELRVVSVQGGPSLLAASPRPRPVPGVPVERNLSGVSFAVANATGALAELRRLSGAAGLLQWLETAGIFARDP